MFSYPFHMAHPRTPPINCVVCSLSPLVFCSVDRQLLLIKTLGYSSKPSCTMSLVVIISPSERKSKELTITCICRLHSTRAAASQREMHRSARCRWNRYSTRLRAAKGGRGAALLVGMEPALGRHELSSLKEKCKGLRCILFRVFP